MNRTAVILFALAILLAHAFAIHQTADGSYAAPYDVAHACYRIARNLVRGGSFAWNGGGPPYESYPSPSWVLVSCVAERLYIGPNVLTQALGTICALLGVIVVAQFSSNRIGGLIAPLLLAFSGAVAAAGGSGTEAGLTMLLVAALALSFERGKRGVFATVSVLLIWTRPEAALLVAVAFALDLLDRPRDVLGARRGPLGRAFVAPLVAWLLLLLLRRSATGFWLSPLEHGALHVDRERFSLGLDYLEGFFLCSGSGILVALPVLALLLRHLTGTGRRVLVLALSWSLLVALEGGDPLPFWNGLVPVLPLLFLAIQESITGWLDRRPQTSVAFLGLLILGFGSSLLVSRTPTDIGPFRIEAWHRAWMQPKKSLLRAYSRSFGRLGLMEEIREVERLRSLGVYLRDRIAAPAKISTFWPGAIGYLSRLEVHDMLGRVTPTGGEDRLRPWSGGRRVDLVQAFRDGGDYVVPILGSLREGTAPADLLHTWLDRYDVVGDQNERLLELLRSLSGYELLAVPVPIDSKDPRVTATNPFLIMRDRALQQAPRLSVRLMGDTFRVLVHHESNQQVADLTVSLRAEDGTTWRMRPTGEFVHEQVVARAGILIYSSGSRPIRLLEGHIPPELHGVRLVAQLHNPGTNVDVPLAAVGAPASVDLPH